MRHINACDFKERHDMKESNYERLASICSRFGFSPATVWRKAKAGTFPKPHKLSAGITAWKTSDLAEWEIDPLNYKVKP